MKNLMMIKGSAFLLMAVLMGCTSYEMLDTATLAGTSGKAFTCKEAEGFAGAKAYFSQFADSVSSTNRRSCDAVYQLMSMSNEEGQTLVFMGQGSETLPKEIQLMASEFYIGKTYKAKTDTGVVRVVFKSAQHIEITSKDTIHWFSS